jgi:hypothetical protein
MNAFEPVDAFDRPPTPQKVGLALHIPVEDDDSDAAFFLVEELSKDPVAALDAVDFLLYKGAEASSLAKLLDDVDHKFRVDGPSRQLMLRVDQTSQHMYDRATTPNDHASALLASAWAKTFSRDRDPSGAWADAIKAIEELLKPIVTPNDSLATLGKMRGALQACPEKWECDLAERPANAKPPRRSPVEVFIDVLWLIPYAPDRHGGSGATDVNDATSRTVVLQAVTICQWLRDGVLRQANE